MKNSLATLFLLLTVPTAVWAYAPAEFHFEALGIESGEIVNHGDKQEVIFQTELEIPGATWLQVHFADVVLPPGTILRTTSLLDGARQHHSAKTLQQWQNRSANFNGDRVLVELLAEPGAAPSRLVIEGVSVGESRPEEICGATDDRVLSDEGRSGRIWPIGCTGWTIDDAKHCQLTAGHCVGGGLTTLELHVPLSNSNGSLNHPGPENQYAIDQTSVQSFYDDGELGNDWGYFGVFPNTETGLTPYQAEGEQYVLGFPPVTLGGETISITGYGTVSTPVSPTWNQVQKTHSGPLVGVSGTILQYEVDTTGGNSGSAVFREDDQTAIGIHTNAGCSSEDGGNHGTSLTNTGLQSALANPQGVCEFVGEIFSDGFESGALLGWSSSTP